MTSRESASNVKHRHRRPRRPPGEQRPTAEERSKYEKFVDYEEQDFYSSSDCSSCDNRSDGIGSDVTEEVHVTLAQDSILGDPDTDQLLAVPPGPPGSVTGSSIGGPDRDSIGSASDILKTDTVDDEERSADGDGHVNNSSSEASNSSEEQSSSDETTDNDQEMDGKHSLVTNQQQRPQHVTRVQIKTAGPRNSNDIMFVGHADGNKPLLFDNDDYEEGDDFSNTDKENVAAANSSANLLIDINDDFSQGLNSLPVTELSSIQLVQKANAVNVRRNSENSNKSIDIHPASRQVRKASSITNASDLDLDAEVERNLICQVIKDSSENAINQDLFGSRPFDTSTVTIHSELNQHSLPISSTNSNLIKSQPVLPLQQTVNPLVVNYQPTNVDQNLNSQHPHQQPQNFNNNNQQINQDLFGAPPFAAPTGVVQAAAGNPIIPPKATQSARPPVPPKSDRVTAALASQPTPAVVPPLYPILPPIPIPAIRQKKRSTSSPPTVKSLQPIESIIDSENPPLIPPTPIQRKLSTDVQPVAVASLPPDALDTLSIKSHHSKDKKKLKDKVTSKITKAYKVDHVEVDDDDVEGLMADEDDIEDQGLSKKSSGGIGIGPLKVKSVRKDKDKSSKDKKKDKDKSKDKDKEKSSKKEKKDKEKSKKEEKEKEKSEKKEKKEKERRDKSEWFLFYMLI